jgi:hypothetical protein
MSNTWASYRSILLLNSFRVQLTAESLFLNFILVLATDILVPDSPLRV